MTAQMPSAQPADTPFEPMELAALSRLGLSSHDQLGTAQVLPPGRQLITEGRPTRRFLLVVSGELRVTRNGRRIGSVGPFGWCGEVGLWRRLWSNDGRATATVTSATQVKVVSFAPWEFKKLIDDHPIAREALEHSACERLRLDSARD